MIKIIPIILFVLLLTRTDRYFFKSNDSFSIRFIYSSVTNDSIWDLPPLPNAKELEHILSQKFTYFAKGTHCYAFESDDHSYVIKFHRYPSHMRLFPWLNHPFAYHFNKKRIGIKEHNLSRYAYFMHNYKMSYEELQEETGVLLLHIHPTRPKTDRKITLIDKTGNHYSVPLDQVTFLLQRKAKLIFPTLESYLAAGNFESAKDSITQIVELIASSYRKGYINNDPVLKRNYGLLSDRAIYIDTGELVKTGDQTGSLLSHVEKVTYPLRDWIIQKCPDLLSHLEETISKHNVIE